MLIALVDRRLDVSDEELVVASDISEVDDSTRSVELVFVVVPTLLVPVVSMAEVELLLLGEMICVDTRTCERLELSEVWDTKMLLALIVGIWATLVLDA